MLSKDTMIQCQWCNTKHKAEEWENNTYAQCISREMRRAYTSIYKESTFSEGANTFYLCPHCGMWSRGSQLMIVDTNDKKLLKIGRKPIIQTTKGNIGDN